MATPTAQEIRARLRDYLTGQRSIDEFEDWFVPVTWDIEGSGDAEAERLTWSIMTPLTEFRSDIIDQLALRRSFAELADVPDQRDAVVHRYPLSS